MYNQYEKARNKYRPITIKTVIIAEAPPEAIDRFFYYEDVKDKDFLFLNIIEVLYPDWKSKYLNSKRSSTVKEFILRKFQSEGYYLLDLFESPEDLKEKNNSKAINKLSKKLSQICNEKTPIVLIKVNVYNIAFKALQIKFNVIDEKIHFPCSGQQSNFKRVFKKVIDSIID